MTPDPAIVTGLYTGVPTSCCTAVCADLSSIINWVTFLSLNVIVSLPINIDPVESQPVVENTSILCPDVVAVPVNTFSSWVLVETPNVPLTVSDARTIL